MTRPLIPRATNPPSLYDMAVFRPMTDEERLELTARASLSHWCHTTAQRYLGGTFVMLPFGFDGMGAWTWTWTRKNTLEV